ncbi:hypothetical protein BJ742DRAFT_675406 [Cladochytrium replicatum]|nr:hypothetical protein BJ742DRAFT_675406 [Cladochytrium replicatum]
MDRSSISISGESLISDLSISAEERAFSYRLAAGDQRGHIYIFNFSDNRFNLLCRTGISATCMAFNRRHGSELLVALSDTSVHCYNIDTGQLVAKLSSHNTEPHCLSVHPNPKVALAISTSRTEAILWDTDGWIRERIMRGENHDGMQQVILCDQPSNDFNNETSFVNLGSEQLRLFRQTELFSAEREGYFALSADGDLLVHYALGFTLQVFNVRERTRLHEILIPELAIEHPDEDRSGIAAVLSNHGNFVLVDTIVGKLVGSVRNTGIETCAVSPDGLVLCLVRKHARHIADLIALDPVRLATDSSDKGNAQRDDSDIVERLVPKSNPVIAKSEPQKSFFEMVESKRESSMLNRIKLAKFVVHCGTYPNNILIWRFLLKLPENREAYEALIGQGIHPAYMSFRQKYPLKSDRTARTVERILSALAFWSPIFEHLEYLPGMIFPFVQVFQGDTYSCFECVMAFLMNWCQKWWDYYPNPPVEVLDIIEDLLAFHDRELFEHFQRLGITSQTYAWVLLSSLFTDACTKAEWQQLMDHVITQGPAFLYYLVVSYQVQFRIQLLHSHRADDIKKFYQRKNAMKLDRFLHRTYLIREKTPDVMSPSSYLRPFKPVLRGAYPIFDQYPSFIVNYQAKLRERIRKDEEDYIRKRRATEEVVKLAEELKRDKRAWEEADKAMSDVVDTWWESMLDEEAAHVEKQSVREALEIEERTKALRRMAKARKSFLQNRAAMSSKAMDVAARTTGEGRRTADVIEETLDLDTQFKDLEREWLERRKELLRARENIAGVDHARFQTLISSRSPSPSRSPNPDQGFRASGSASRVGSQDQRTRSQREIPLQM